LRTFYARSGTVVRSDAPGGDPWRRQSKAIALHGRFVHAQANPQSQRRY
jgi:hypothetical protein